jgi:hypothetical protein
MNAVHPTKLTLADQNEAAAICKYESLIVIVPLLDTVVPLIAINPLLNPVIDAESG